MLDVNRIKDVVVPLARKYGVRKIYLFGSYARGEAEQNSDIDLKVDNGDHPIGLFALSGLRLEIREQLGKPVDLVTQGGLYENVKKEIAKEEILLYECKE
ncbi:nucleotidyltransferase domain-containing protein [Eubacterium sp. 1001713B170207_170306_E7]|uniref:nucleotidyltransferase family protein n=1 Tax=Eubacterium sp. 1001713B170207_170306_E7 TaxID=2787097 RepID=UPI00325FD5BC